MKKVFLLTLVLLPLVAQLKAQNCRDIVLPHYNYNEAYLERVPQEKMDYMCQYSQNAFFETDKVPAGAMVFDFSALTANRDGSHPASNFVVNLSTLSYYAYNFFDFQAQDYHNTVYFRTPGSAHSYLGVRCVDEIHRLSNPEQ